MTITSVSGNTGFGRGRPLVLGHRGAPSLARENTIAAFRAARAAAADGVELDVRRTADGALVVHHDATVFGGDAIVGLTLAQLYERDPEIPTLDAALEACAGLVVNVEIKNWPTDPDFDTDQRVAAAVARRVESVPGVVVSSFNPFALEQVQAVASGVEVAALAAGLGPEATVQWIADAAARGFGGVHPETAMATPEAIGAAHALGLAVRVWTVDDPAVAVAAAAAGVQAVITNDPAGILAALVTA